MIELAISIISIVVTTVSIGVTIYTYLNKKK